MYDDMFYCPRCDGYGYSLGDAFDGCLYCWYCWGDGVVHIDDYHYYFIVYCQVNFYLRRIK